MAHRMQVTIGPGAKMALQELGAVMGMKLATVLAWYLEEEAPRVHGMAQDFNRMKRERQARDAGRAVPGAAARPAPIDRPMYRAAVRELPPDLDEEASERKALPPVETGDI